MEMYKIEIIAEWDDDAEVWVAQSKDVDGLVVEAKTLDEVSEIIRDVLPDLAHQINVDPVEIKMPKSFKPASGTGKSISLDMISKRREMMAISA